MSPTRRVFIFSREYPPLTVGGTSTVARSLAKGLAAEGWQVLVVTSHTGTDDVHELVDDVSVLRTGTGVLYNGETGLRDQSLRTHRRILAAANWLVSVLGPPDLVALPDLFCYPEAMLLAREHSVPLINVLLQDFEAITPYDRDGHRVTTGTTADRADLLAIEAKALRTSDHTVFISHALRDAITGRYGVDSATQSVVHLGVDPAEIAAVEADSGRFERLTALRGASAPAAPLLVACGRLVPVKGFDVLLTALARLGPVHRPGSGPALVQLAVVGVGPEEGLLRQRATDLGLTGQIAFLGDIRREEALGWMSVADVAVVPSLWESFCYVCAEMMAFGRPVVASSVDSLRELIPDDSVGYPVPVEGASGSRRLDPDSLAKTLRCALEDPVGAAARGALARERIMERFTNDRFGRQMSSLGVRLIAERNR
ncbi:glycosyltransferase family 4 protein [Kitasatospora sp. NBC_01266]|uniref:glycosyltransferase family 4 protein n=1 Tax=Kitasatospora sp. NBC_01266 TaxID=2903572 RepID=UPI002E363462|nr:glycosyltransferase family 4 protein [Kitasatospora sp. NBC_01266]